MRRYVLLAITAALCNTPDQQLLSVTLDDEKHSLQLPGTHDPDRYFEEMAAIEAAKQEVARSALDAADAAIAWARDVSRMNLRSTTDDLSWLDVIVEEFSCDLNEARLFELSPQQASLARSYSVKCSTYREWWAELERACSLRPRPFECRYANRTYKLLNVDQYIIRIVRALERSSIPIERFNLMIEAVGLAPAHVVYEWPKRNFERKISMAMDVYFRSASLTDVQRVTLFLQESFMGLPAAARGAVRRYAKKTPGLSELERSTLIEMSRARWVEPPEEGL